MAEFELFDYDEEDEYTLPDFFTHFKDKLPMLVIVVGGDYGMTKWDDLSNDTILRYHQYHGLKRVVARPSEEAKRDRLEYLSIPVLAPYRYQIVKSRQQTGGPDKSMEEILNENPLPVLVRFCPSKAPDIIDKTKNPTFLLTKVYEEYYLQGNCFINDKLQPLSIATFLSPNITVTPILGLKDNTKEEFEKYEKQLDEYVRKHVKFSPHDCNLSVKKFHFGDKGFENIIDSNEVIMSPSDEPKPAPPPRKGQAKDSHDQGLYEVPDEDDVEDDHNDNYEVVEDDMIAKKLPPKPQAKKKDEQDARPELPPRPTEEEKEQHTKKNAADDVKEKQKKKPAAKTRNKDKETVPDLPSRSVDAGKEKLSKSQLEGETTEKKAEYENDIVCPVSPFSATRTEGVTKKEDSDVPKKEQPGKNETQEAPTEYLSIKEVGDVLKKLNLSKYIEPFEKESVDSEILRDFNEDILRDEFNFTRLETIRLMKFIKTGHIPR